MFPLLVFSFFSFLKKQSPLCLEPPIFWILLIAFTHSRPGPRSDADSGDTSCQGLSRCDVEVGGRVGLSLGFRWPDLCVRSVVVCHSSEGLAASGGH